MDDIEQELEERIKEIRAKFGRFMSLTAARIERQYLEDLERICDEYKKKVEGKDGNKEL